MRDESDKLPDAVFKLPQEAQRALVTLSGMAASPMRIHPRDAKEAVAYVVAAILESARQPVGQEAGETWLFKQAAGLLHARIVSASGRVVAIFKSDVSDEDGARLAGGTPPTQKGVSNG
jgi:hypothetical protein